MINYFFHYFPLKIKTCLICDMHSKVEASLSNTREKTSSQCPFEGHTLEKAGAGKVVSKYETNGLHVLISLRRPIPHSYINSSYGDCSQIHYLLPFLSQLVFGENSF